MDYDLSRLSSRSFEQMVQALAVGVLGPGLAVFGDGPDGGREAIYRGETTFAPHGRRWVGETVVQAKFRQRPLGTEIDGPWALDALKGELTKFAERAGGRSRPANIVFVTNAVLSPAVGGGKDQAIAELEHAKSAWGLVDYDVWDYDKLRTLLDRDDEVRTRFGWITAGDVLAAMLGRIQDCGPDFERTIVNYLEKTLIGDRYVRLEEAGHSAEEPTPLSRVFVDLPVADAGAGESGLFLRDLLEHTAVLFDEGERPVRATGRVVLVGGPGQGKTTLGQFACQVFRAGLLSSVQRPLSPDGRDAVAAVAAACHESDLHFGRGPRFPVRVVLTDLAKGLTAREQPLLAWIANSISRRVGATIAVEHFRRWLGAYPWFLVLDGLDEVPAGAGRDRVMSCIEDFQVDVAQERADVFVLATTRPQGYNDDFSPRRYDHRRLADLPPQAALDYGSRLAGARYGAGADRTATVIERLGRAVVNPATLHLMRSTLQVAIMTALVDRLGQPPNERWSLFDSYYDVIYQRERERDTDAASILGAYRPDVDAIHQRVGLALHVLTTSEAHADPRLTGAQLTRLVTRRLAEEGHAGDETAAMAARIRDAAELRLVFLVGGEEDRIGFEIRSLQEFMAAGALVDGPDEQVVARLRAIAPLPGWRNVLLFAAGECFVRRQHLRSHLHDLCRSLDVDPADPLHAPMKVGARLALDLLEDGVARSQPRQHRVIAAHAFDVLDVADPALSMRLARCHHDDLDDLYRARLSDAVTSSDEIRRTSARRCLATLSSDGLTWARSTLRDAGPPQDGAEAFALLDELPQEVFDNLDRSFAATCVSSLDHRALRSLSDDGCLRNLFDGLWWSGNWRVERKSVLIAATSLGLWYVPACPLTVVGVNRWTADDRRALPPSATLAVYHAAEAFADDPSRETLTAVLGDIAESSTPEVWVGCAFEIPWPLGAVLARSATARDLERAVAELRLELSGAVVRSPSDLWTRAEETWEMRGIDLVRDCLGVAPRFPLEVAGGRVRGRPAATDAARLRMLVELRALSEAAHPGVANLARILLERAALTSRFAPAGVAELTELLQTLGDAATEVDVAILRGQSVEDLAQILASVQPATRFTVRERGSISLSTVTRLLACVGTSPSPRALEALAFAMAGCEQTPEGAVALSLDQDDPHARACAAYIALLRHDRRLTARELGRRFADADDPDDALSALLDSEHAADSDGWDEFLAGCLERAPRTWAEQRWIDRLMREALSRRSTTLVDRSVWREFGLFEPHPLALAQRPSA
jgi:hypothetical protein